MFNDLKSLLHFTQWPYFKACPLLGLDLGFNEIRLLQLEKRGSVFHLAKLLTHPIPNEGLEKKDPWLQGQAPLGSLVTQAKLKGYSVALALPSSALIKKQIELPLHFSEDEIASELRLSMSQYFPGLSEKEVYFDFAFKPATADKHQVLLVATRKEPLQSRVMMLRQAGLRAKIVDVDLYALARAALRFFYQEPAEKKAAVALLDVSWPFFTFLAFCEKDLVFYHQWQVAGGLLAAPLDPGYDLIPQVRTVWQLCQASHPKLKLELLGLSGDLPGLDQLAALLQRQFSLPTRVINPFQGMTISSRLQAPVDCPSRFLRCCGLGLRGVVS